MDITIHLSERESAFLQKMIDRQKMLFSKGDPREYTIEDAVHECIRDSMFDEGEVDAKEEFE